MKGVAPVVLVLITLGVIGVTVGTTIAIARTDFPPESPLWGMHIAIERVMCNFNQNITERIECHKKITEEIVNKTAYCMSLNCPRPVFEKIYKELRNQEREMEKIQEMCLKGLCEQKDLELIETVSDRIENVKDIVRPKAGIY